jgi:hypothetical protein
MASVQLAIIGAGSVRCTPRVLAALATYFGERPLEIRIFDADEERLDLFDRLARFMFLVAESNHRLLFRTDPAEALEDADRVIFQVGSNCARHYLRAIGGRPTNAGPQAPEGSLQVDGYLPPPQDSAMIQDVVDLFVDQTPADAEILSLQRSDIGLPLARRVRRLDWPSDLSLRERIALPHQVLRWIKGEEAIQPFLLESERSPLKSWLDDVTTASLV